jgi:membrane-bound ClpP family serine protease
MWSRQIMLRYSLLQLPEVVLLIMVLFLIRQWIHIPMWVVWMFSSILLMINVIMYPFVWRAYDKSVPNALSGSRGITVDRLSPSGHVRINGELWQAIVTEGHEPIEKGGNVTVKDIQGLTLIVESDTIREVQA